MEVIKKIIRYNFNTNNNAKYIVIHNTDNPTASALNHFAYWNSGNVGGSAHYVLDDKHVIQCIEHQNQAWHCGKLYVKNPKTPQCTNVNSIGIEICNATNVDFEKAMENAIWLVKKLTKELNIPLENVITHQECTGKKCPSTILKLGKWDWFKSQLIEKSIDEKLIEAVNKLQGDGIISTPDMWSNVEKINPKFISDLIIKYVKSKLTYEQAVSILVDNKIISSEDLWLSGNVTNKNCADLIKKL